MKIEEKNVLAGAHAQDISTPPTYKNALTSFEGTK
jgi:hypothetical protein